MFHEICGTAKAEPDFYRLDSIQLTIHALPAKVYHDTIVGYPPSRIYGGQNYNHPPDGICIARRQ